MNKNTHYLFWAQANGVYVKLRFAVKEKIMAIGSGVLFTVIGNAHMGLKYKFWNNSLNAPGLTLRVGTQYNNTIG